MGPRHLTTPAVAPPAEKSACGVRQEGAGAGQGRDHLWEAGAGLRDRDLPHPQGPRRAWRMASNRILEPGLGKWLGPTEEGRGTGRQGNLGQEVDVQAAEIGGGD